MQPTNRLAAFHNKHEPVGSGRPCDVLISALKCGISDMFDIVRTGGKLSFLVQNLYNQRVTNSNGRRHHPYPVQKLIESFVMSRAP